MAAALALLTSGLYGTADFFGGLATRRNNAVVVLFVGQTVGMIGLAVTLPLFGAVFAWRDLGIGAGAGLIGLAGLALLYRGLAKGPMAVVAPLTAITAAVVPVGWDLVDGARPSTATSIGMVTGLVAIAVVSIELDSTRPSVSASTVFEALAAGFGFGLFFVLISRTSPESAPWPVMGSRVVSVALLGLVVAARRLPLTHRRDRRVMVGSGLCDTGANITFLLALEYGSLAPVAVLSSLYPAATVIWARVVLGERIDRQRTIGLCAAVASVALIAGG
jgi:drug/metabolite transporter (DMT)-like permease